MKSFNALSIGLLLLTATAWAHKTSTDCNDCSVSVDTCKTCDDCSGALYLPRPQQLYSPVFFDPFYYPCDSSCIDTCWNFNLGFRYHQTRNPEYIAQCLFGSDKLAFIGSQIAPEVAEGSKPILADNFGLSQGFNGTMTFNPRIQNYIVDFGARWELGNWFDCLECLYAGVAMSLVHSRWDLDACEAIVDGGSPTAPACYMDTAAAPVVGTIKQALSGDAKFGQMKEPWTAGQFIFDSQNDTTLANIDMFLGYDFLRCDTYHFGIFAKASAPTGTRPGHDADSRAFFSPIIGNGHHWELGGGLDAHWQLWSCDEQCIAAYLNGSVTHLFKDKQFRSFDLKTADVDGIEHADCLSRYQLLKEFNTDGVYAGHLVNGINFTTRQVKSSFDVMGDASLRLLYRNCGWALGLGYNVYGRSKEKLSDVCAKCEDGRTFGITGLSGVCVISRPPVVGTLQPISATQSGARIDNQDFPDTDNAVKVPGFKNWHDGEAFTSADPVELTDKDLNKVGVARQLSQSVFGHIDYQWDDCDWKPYLGVGGAVEFAQDAKCNVCTANTWTVWFRGGVTF